MEFNTTSTEKRLSDSWLTNLRIAGSISTNTVEKAVSWNVGPHGYQKGKKEIHQIFEQGPPIICLQDVQIPKRRKNAVKRELQRVFPITGSTSPQPRVPGKTVETDHMYIRF